MTGEDFEEAQNDWLNGAAELDGLCEPYGYGKGVVGKARSITVEDVDSVTGYDKTTYGKGTVGQYGNEVTYSYKNSIDIKYTSKVKSGTLTYAHSDGFYYYDGNEFKVANDLTTKDTGTITTLKSDYYYYEASGLTTISKTDNAKAYEMIFGDGVNSYYWLASPCVNTNTDYARFRMRYVGYGNVDGYYLWDSLGISNANSASFGVRAVVALSSDITFTGNSTRGWNY